MKKTFAILMATCFILSALCVTAVPAFALTVSSNDVIRVYGLKDDGTTVILNGYTNFEEGWEAAVDYAEDHDYMDENDYGRIVVELLTDWKANEKGEFGDSSGDGFQQSTIYVPDGARITINLNGHTINRGLTKYEYDGEVVYIEEDSDVIINNGTITGGFSCNGAGGIHIMDDARVTLNDVKVVGNKALDDDGAGIAVYDGASLTMNGGCVSNNVSYDNVYGGGVYIDEASAVFNNVIFENNQGFERSTQGAAVYVDDGTLVMDGCKVMGNGLAGKGDGEAHWVACSIINILNGSQATIKNTSFIKNGGAQETYAGNNTLKYTSVISSKAGYLTMENCVFTDNNQVYLIDSEATKIDVIDSDLSGNNSFAFYGNCAGGLNSAFTNCKFSYSKPVKELEHTFFFNISNAGLSFVDCEFGDATFNNKGAARFVETDAKNGIGSIFGDGSLTTIIAILALVVSIVAVGISIVSGKKKDSFAPTDDKNDKE